MAYLTIRVIEKNRTISTDNSGQGFAKNKENRPFLLSKYEFRQLNAVKILPLMLKFNNLLKTYLL
jgi:hypothetical protein